MAGGEGVASGPSKGPYCIFLFSLLDVTVDVWLLVQIYGSICGTYYLQVHPMVELFNRDSAVMLLATPEMSI